jgi:hypothetical protein
MDDTRNDGEDARWVSYAQLAHERGISKESAIRLVRRECWRKMPGNDADKTVRVLVPQTWLQPAARADDLPDMARIEAAEARADEAHKRADAALALADRTLSQLVDANARADRAEDVADAQRRRVTALQHDLDTARAAAQQATQAADAFRAAVAPRRARGRWARLRAALRGE